MVAPIDTIKTKKASQLNTQLNVYKEGKTQAIQKIKSGSIFNTDIKSSTQMPLIQSLTILH